MSKQPFAQVDYDRLNIAETNNTLIKQEVLAAWERLNVVYAALHGGRRVIAEVLYEGSQGEDENKLDVTWMVARLSQSEALLIKDNDTSSDDLVECHPDFWKFWKFTQTEGGYSVKVTASIRDFFGLAPGTTAA